MAQEVDEWLYRLGRELHDAAQCQPLFVKVDNNPTARPHFGIAKADQVYEWLVEGLTTRLAAVFHSQQPDVIGSVRSARMTDRPILPSLGAAFVYTGGGPEELMAIHYDDAVAHRYIDIGPSYGWGYRVPFRPAPYNYFTSYAALKGAIAAAPDGDQPAIVAPWSFLPAATGDPLAGGFTGSVPATKIAVPYRARLDRACGAGRRAPACRQRPGHRRRRAGEQQVRTTADLRSRAARDRRVAILSSARREARRCARRAIPDHAPRHGDAAPRSEH